MYKKSIALFIVAICYGRSAALAALPDSCFEGDTSCGSCTPQNTEYEPVGTGQLWYSTCCSESETDSADPPFTTTTTKKYCWNWTLKDYPSNQNHGQKPACSDKAVGNLAWTLEGQCTTITGNANDVPYETLDDNGTGCPGQYDPRKEYEVDDMVEDNGTVYTCTNSGAFCSLYGPDLRGVGLLYWRPMGSCVGTADPTEAPTFGTTQEGCPAEFDSSTEYSAGDAISVMLKDGRSVWYTCKNFPASQFCNVDIYSPLSTELQCNGELCWPDAWNYQGGCAGTYTPTTTPTFDPANVEGCPEEYDSGTTYVSGDEVSVLEDGLVYGKIYQCRAWPEGGNCVKEAYRPGGDAMDSDGVTPLWKSAWAYEGGCSGTITPTIAPTFDPADLEGCPEEYDSGTTYVSGDEVSVLELEDGLVYGKIYQCRVWPEGGNCVKEAYRPGGDAMDSDGVTPLWKSAWAYEGGCSGTITPTIAPTFDPANVEGCPEEYDSGTTYAAGDEVSVLFDGETAGKIYQCKPWPDTGYCNLEAYKPGGDALEPDGSKPLWKRGWTYEGGCSGTISPTQAPVFVKLAEWDLQGCPPEYVSGYPYRPLDHVSISKNDDNTYGVVFQCKDGESSPWCQNEGYAPGTLHAEQAWEKVGHCSGTISPTYAPSAVEDNPDNNKDTCQFKKRLSKTLGDDDEGQYVILSVLSWESGGYTEATVSGGVPFTMYEPGDLVRSGRDTYKCSGYPYTPWCTQHSPFVKDSSYNSYSSSKAWIKAECEELTDDPDAVFGVTTSSGAVFASNGNLLVDKDGVCQTGEDTPADSGAINEEDYFKTQPTSAKPCQKCGTDKGLGAPIDSSGTLSWDPKICEACLDGTTGTLVDRVSRCVCDNGATDPWDVSDSDAQCTKCPGGKKFLGYNFGQGQGKCVDACPSSHPYYYTKTVTASTDKYYVCCEESGCDGVSNTDLSGCYDGGAVDAVGGTGVCEAAYPPTTSTWLSPSMAPSTSSGPSATPSLSPSASVAPSSQPSSVPSSSGQPSLQPSTAPSLSGQPSLNPTIEVTKLLPNDGAAGDYFGYAVSLSGDTLAVGAIYDGDNGSNSGSVYVFVHDGDTWKQQAKLLPNDGAANDNFGYAVSLSGDTLAIGAERDDDNGSSSGSAYIFVRNGDTWKQQAKLLPNDGAAGDYFGYAVSLSGNTVAVGSRWDDDNGDNSGSVYVFVHDRDTWKQQAKLLPNDGAAGDYFGHAVSLSGNTVAVGSYWAWDDDNGIRSGSAYIFVRNGDTWKQQAKLLPNDGAAGDYFGYAVSLSGDTVAVGSRWDDDNGDNSGSAYVFVRDGDMWKQQAKLLPNDGAADDNFGRAVSLSNNVLAVGSYGDDDNGSNSGSAYVFVRDGDTWEQQAKLLPNDGAKSDSFGYAVSMSNNLLAVGAIFDDDNGSTSGSVYVFPLALV